MRKRTWTVLLASLLVAAQAEALEPDDLVIGVGTSLYTVDPLTGALDLLSEGPDDWGLITGIAVRPDGLVFFTQTSVSGASIRRPENAARCICRVTGSAASRWIA